MKNMATQHSLSRKCCAYIPKLAIFLSIAVALAHGNPITLHLICTGPHSDLTYDDCQGAYHSNESACYFVENLNHYRPCASICNDVQIHTRKEDKCDSYCNGKEELKHTIYFGFYVFKSMQLTFMIIYIDQPRELGVDFCRLSISCIV